MTREIPTVAERLKRQFDNLTRAERQLANCILENYPASGLGTITTLGKRADVSTPTITRMMQKLGFPSFPDFQTSLRQELEARISDPITKRDIWTNRAPTEHILNRFTEAVISNISHSLGQTDTDSFDKTCALIADGRRRVFVVGGRITRTLADYMFLHLQVIRPRVTHIQSLSNAWPHYLLDVTEGDVVIIFDVRRYETSTLKLAEIAFEKGAEIILFTDQWGSPVSKLATHSFANQIAVPSAWDSAVTNLLLLEIMIAEIQERIWPKARTRMKNLETMFDDTRLFRKFT